MNMWGYLIEGLTGILSNVLNQLPVGNVNAILGNGATILYFAIAPLLIFVGSFVNLQLLAFCLSLIISLSAVKAVIAVYRWVLKLIPMAS